MKVTLYAKLKTDQQVFDAVCSHLAQQKQQAKGDRNCMYYVRSNGHRCAIGGVVPVKTAQYLEVHYSSEGVDDIPGLSIPETVSEELLRDLQLAHDWPYSKESLHRELHRVAEEYDLDDSKVKLITEWGKPEE